MDTSNKFEGISDTNLAVDVGMLKQLEQLEQLSNNGTDRVLSQLDDEKFRRKEQKRKTNAVLQMTDIALIKSFPQIVKQAETTQMAELGKELRELKNCGPDSSSSSSFQGRSSSSSRAV